MGVKEGDWNNNNTESRLKESWAQGVEWLFASERYSNFDNRYVYQNNYQNFTVEEWPIYTSLMVDLFDDLNQRDVNGNLQLPLDRVEGYTFLQMENCLRRSNGFTQFRNQLRDRHENNTEELLNELFENWE